VFLEHLAILGRKKRQYMLVDATGLSPALFPLFPKDQRLKFEKKKKRSGLAYAWRRSCSLKHTYAPSLACLLPAKINGYIPIIRQRLIDSTPKDISEETHGS
jgi:hypothetical protein